MPTLIRTLKSSRTSIPLLMLVLLSTVSFSVLDPADPPQAQRAPTNEEKAPLLMDGPHKKISRLMDVEIELLSLPPEKESDEVRLRAKVILVQTVDLPLEFRWMLPEGSKVIAGEVSGKKNPPLESLEFELTVSGLNPSSMVHFVAHFRDPAGNRFGSTGVISFKGSVSEQ